ncbi:DgaE family pyridoxal phosphate-dependent ammonia lyase [Enterovibrio norvegicus]|uniref:DgaE family pyridoxal phosphate-dependent ammonia lyase n=1 Tax=Enterovibrio norvegicus TaxID=188144 RepID=UPI000C830E2A|nr:DgaE family pyridoxal phosphate-dependent ammonia lyase [Enterovibrio norvegicus]PML81629.1 L-seryl-tRNA selenium transferase [Enterovibrio norvegicus]
MSSILEKYNLKHVINASGRMTALGVSTPLPEVEETVCFGLNHYFEMKDLVNKSGEYIARLLDVENAVVVSSASAGIAQSVAAMIVRGNAYRLEHLHAHAHDVPTEIVIPKGHNVNYGAPVGTMINLGGGRIVEAGWSNECSAAQLGAAINANTAAILYIKSHHCVQKSMLTVEDAAAVAKAHNVPLIVDAAAEEDLRLYYQQGADLVIYSGAKAIEGPTSGLVLGKHEYVEWVKQQTAGIGRAMKVGKEGILGLTHAIELYLERQQESGTAMVEKMAPFINGLNALPGIQSRVVWDSAGRDIARAEVSFDADVFGLSAKDAVTKLQNGNPAVYCRAYKANEGSIEFDVRSVSQEQLQQVLAAMTELNQE